MLENNDAITQALKLLVLTDQYERLCQPNIYTNIRALLFENLTPTSAVIADDYIRNATRNHEQRANITNLEVLQNPDEHKIALVITYAGVNNLQDVKVVLFLDKIR